MSARLYYALSTGALALLMAVILILLVGRDSAMQDAYAWIFAATVGACGLLGGLWVGRWRWLVHAGGRVWRPLGVAFFTVLVALGAMFLLYMVLLGVTDAGDWREAAEVAAFIVCFGALFCGLPAVLLTLPLAGLFLRRHDHELAT